tara:strand:+ start:73475 stop:73618 length:144 start_codon:yes stop_codon:yes gene_type:complete
MFSKTVEKLTSNFDIFNKIKRKRRISNLTCKVVGLWEDDAGSDKNPI